MKLTDIKHVFFDLDHTLWDFEKNSALAFEEVFKKNNIGLKTSEFLEIYSPINFNYWELYRNDEVSKEALRYGRIKDSFDQLQFETSDDTINGIADDYIHFLPANNHLLEGSLEILEYLREKYELHIITNGFQEVQGKKLENSGIRQYFETVTTSEEVGVKKPNPKIFNHAMEKASAHSSNSVMIGDNLDADIIGAHNLGLKVIYLSGNELGEEHKQYNPIQKLKELDRYL